MATIAFSFCLIPLPFPRFSLVFTCTVPIPTGTHSRNLNDRDTYLLRSELKSGAAPSCRAIFFALRGCCIWSTILLQSLTFLRDSPESAMMASTTHARDGSGLTPSSTVNKPVGSLLIQWIRHIWHSLPTKPAHSSEAIATMWPRRGNHPISYETKLNTSPKASISTWESYKCVLNTVCRLCWRELYTCGCHSNICCHFNESKTWKGSLFWPLWSYQAPQAGPGKGASQHLHLVENRCWWHRCHSV